MFFCYIIILTYRLVISIISDHVTQIIIDITIWQVKGKTK
nr:MAG TPA: hypothetical protein [Caudoviricetes sp.]